LQPIGEALRSAREARGASLADAALATRIRASHLEALEHEAFGALGGAVYVKGFLRGYAGWLGLDPEPLVAAFRAGGGDDQDVRPPVRAGGLRPIEAGFGGFGRRRRPSWLLLGSVVAGLVLAVSVLSLVSSGGGDEPPPVAVPTTRARVASQTTRPAPATTVPAGQVQVVLAYTEASWTKVRIDGRTAFTGTPAAGERRTFTGRDKVDVTLGNAGVVELTVNGRRRGPAGATGQVWRGAFSANQRP
jgi:cytoskeletal protein RodZ